MCSVGEAPGTSLGNSDLKKLQSILVTNALAHVYSIRSTKMTNLVVMDSYVVGKKTNKKTS